MTILDSLKALLKKMGGTSAASTNTISEVIGEITSAYQNGGGGGGVVVVHVTEEEDVFTLDKTWNELQELLSSGALVATLTEGNGFTTMMFLTQAYSYSGTYAVAFVSATITPEWAGQTAVSVYSCESADGYPYVED